MNFIGYGSDIKKGDAVNIIYIRVLATESRAAGYARIFLVFLSYTYVYMYFYFYFPMYKVLYNENYLRTRDRNKLTIYIYILVHQKNFSLLYYK